MVAREVRTAAHDVVGQAQFEGWSHSALRHLLEEAVAHLGHAASRISTARQLHLRTEQRCQMNCSKTSNFSLWAM